MAATGEASDCEEAPECGVLTEYVVTRWYRAPEVLASVLWEDPCPCDVTDPRIPQYPKQVKWLKTRSKMGSPRISKVGQK
eukprot:3710525-Amphidinium_carterae.1